VRIQVSDRKFCIKAENIPNIKHLFAKQLSNDEEMNDV